MPTSCAVLSSSSCRFAITFVCDAVVIALKELLFGGTVCTPGVLLVSGIVIFSASRTGWM